ncbi:MAG: sulfite exporter TauE/SafE family protein [Kiloniellaceae bacterium]
MDFITVLLVVAAAFGTAVFHSVGGFAGGLLLAIFLAPILGVKETVPVTATAMIISNSTRVWVFRHSVNWRAFGAVFGVAAPFIIFSAMVYVSLPEMAVALMLGTFLVISVPLRRYMDKRNFRVGVKGLALSAVPYGLISGSTFGAGMMLAPFLLGFGLAGEYLVGTVAAIGFGLNLTKSVVFGFSPLLGLALLAKGVLIGLCTIPGAYVGRWIVRSTSLRVHSLFMEALILCGAAYFLWKFAEGFG